MELKEKKQLFFEPTSEFRGKPFWSWNGKLEEVELKRQIDIMKEMGFGGYFMHSRTGLETEYLGSEWFSLINTCADYGSSLEMESWLYDEDRWPSGSAGGMVTKEEKYRAMYLEMQIKDPEDYNKWKRSKDVQAVFACQTEDGICKEKRILEIGDDLKMGEQALIFRVQYADGEDFYNGFTYLDTMNREAVMCYLQMTHDKYKEKCKDRLGNEIKGIFTDEPHRGAAFSGGSGNSGRQVPFTPELFIEFEKRFGYDLKTHLPELFLKKTEGEVSRVTYHYYELCQELFLENFALPVSEWCRQNNLILTGHVFHEDSLSAQAIMQGSLMRFYEYMDYPGIDILAEKNTCYWVVKQAVSVARQLDKPWVLSELYGCTGWQMSLEAYKNIGDWQALLGINVRCPHLSWYTMKGEAKRDYPASILHQSPWYKDYHYLEDYFSRIHVALHEGSPDCGLLVLNPVESVWGKAYSGAFMGLDAVDENIKGLERQYQDIFHWLCGAQIDFDYGDEDIVARYGSVEEGLLCIGKASYKKVLAAGMETIRGTTLKLLEKFRKQGGEVIFAGKLPVYVDAVPSAAAGRLAEVCHVIPFTESSVTACCASGNEIRLVAEEKSNIYIQSRTQEGGRMIMLLNMNRKNSVKQIKAIIPGKGHPELWDARRGRIMELPHSVHNGSIEIVFDLEAGGERLIFLAEQEQEQMQRCDSVIKPVCKGIIELPDSFFYQLTEPNICVLDKVTIRGEEGFTLSAQEVLKADQELRGMLGISRRSGQMLQPWYEVKYHDVYQKKLKEITLEYEVELAILPTGVEMAVEDLTHITEITVNGRAIPLQSEGKWIDIAFDRIMIMDNLWVKGNNKIALRMDYYKTSGVEAIYLLGGFGVEINGGSAVITSMPKQLRIGDITCQSLPFYSGSVIYKIEGAEEQEVCVKADSFGGSLIKLHGKEEVVIAFPPYTESVNGLTGIEVVLTRRNTFGPLHQLPKDAYAYGPDNFLTTGKGYSEGYVFYKQGLLGKPELFLL